jgi:hypothetical protein
VEDWGHKWNVRLISLSWQLDMAATLEQATASDAITFSQTYW